jgi:putative membrane protein
MVCGFLDSGKTDFLAPIVTDDKFTDGAVTLLLVTEEGENEYDPVQLAAHDVVLRVIDDKEDFTRQTLTALDEEICPDQVMLEYNGMWQVTDINGVLPENWDLYQIITTVDATTFESYMQNIGSLMMQHIRNADLVSFNRVTDDLALMLRGRNIRMLNRRADIYLEYTDERVEEYDDGTPPFDLSLAELDLQGDDYGAWYTDAMENPDRYDGKIIHFLGQVAVSPEFGPNACAVGRFAMVCCEADTTFLGILMRGPQVNDMETGDWFQISGRVSVEPNPLYDEPGPVLDILDLQPAQAPTPQWVYC